MVSDGCGLSVLEGLRKMKQELENLSLKILNDSFGRTAMS